MWTDGRAIGILRGREGVKRRAAADAVATAGSLELLQRFEALSWQSAALHRHKHNRGWWNLCILRPRRLVVVRAEGKAGVLYAVGCYR